MNHSVSRLANGLAKAAACALLCLLATGCQPASQVSQLSPEASETVRAQAGLCDEGLATGCYALAWAFLNHDSHHGVAQDENRAKEVFARACTLGMPEGCTQATALAEGRPVSMAPPASPYAQPEGSAGAH